MSYRALALLLAVFLITIGLASAYGSSVEDLVGVFSIEKTIKLGSSSACFGSPEAQKDPLGIARNSMADDQPPSLAGFGIEPKIVDKSLRAINLTAHIIDDESGLGQATAVFCSPSGEEEAEAIFYPGNRVSGTEKDGAYAAKMILPKKSEKGAWLLENMTLMDGSGNSKVLQRGDMARMGLPAEFLVD